MEFNQETKTLVIFNKKKKLETVVNSLSNLSAKQIEGFFIPRGIQFPKKIHYLALLKVLNERIKKLHSLSLSKDGFEKLAHYANFTEFQLMILFSKVGTPEDFIAYRKAIWELVLINFATINLTDGEAQYLINLKKQTVEDFSLYSSIISKIGLDLQNEFDGCPKNQLVDSFKFVYTNEEISIMAKTYGITISNRLKKTELLDCIKGLMKNQKRLTVALENELNAMTVTQLNSFAELHKLHISSNLRKDDLVYYFLYLLERQSIPTLKIKRIIGGEDISPLAFSVDLDVIQPFGKGTPKKIIYFDGDEEEGYKEEEVVVIDTPIEETVVEEVKEDNKEDITEEEVSQEEVIVEENKVEEVTEVVEEILATEEIIEEVLENEEISDGVLNPLFRSKKLEKKLGKRIFYLVFTLIILGFLVTAFLLIKKYL